MAIQILASVLIAVCICLFLVSVKSLLKNDWFMKWLRGSLGFTLILFSVFILIFALDLFSYSKSGNGETLATLKFKHIQDQEFDVELVNSSGQSNNYILQGDQWQLDVRLVRLLGVFNDELPSYKLERLSGRYLSLEQEKNAPRTVHGLADGKMIDTWQWLTEQKWLSIIQAKNGSAAFMPISDGAIYQVKLTQKGLMAEAINEQAKIAVENWQ